MTSLGTCCAVSHWWIMDTTTCPKVPNSFYMCYNFLLGIDISTWKYYFFTGSSHMKNEWVTHPCESDSCGDILFLCANIRFLFDYACLYSGFSSLFWKLWGCIQVHGKLLICFKIHIKLQFCRFLCSLIIATSYR